MLMNAGAHGGRPMQFNTTGLLRYAATRGALTLLQMVFGCTNSVFFFEAPIFRCRMKKRLLR